MFCVRFATNFCRMFMNPKKLLFPVPIPRATPLRPPALGLPALLHFKPVPRRLWVGHWLHWHTRRMRVSQLVARCGFCCLTVGRKNINDATALLKHTQTHTHFYSCSLFFSRARCKIFTIVLPLFSVGYVRVFSVVARTVFQLFS